MVKLQLTLIMLSALAVADNHEETQAEEAPTEEPSVWNNWNGNPEPDSYFD